MDPTSSEPIIDGVSVKQLWIIQDSGMCLFHVSFAPSGEIAVCTELFTGFISALSSFATEATKKSVRKISMGDTVLTQYKKNDLLACLATKEDVKNESLLLMFLDKLLNEFEGDYRKLLDTEEVFELKELTN